MNPTKDPIWDWDTETSSVDGTDQTWSNISLESEEEGPLGGTLQFQREDSNLMVQDDNLENTTMENIQLNEYTRDSGDQNLDSSLAYKLGMFVVSGAAQVVNNVADGGKNNRETIKRLRAELDASLEAQEKLKAQLIESKEWVAISEQENSSLEQRLDEQTKQFGEDVAKLTKKNNNFLQESRERTENAIFELKSKLGESYKQIDDLLEKNSRLTEESNKRTSEIAQQPTTSKAEQNHFASSSNVDLSATIELKNKQLDDATRALTITHTRCDQLRHQLKMSMNSMRAQTDQMKLSTQTLSSAMNESKELKERVKVVEAKSRNLEEKYEEENKLKMAAIDDLQTKEGTIEQLTNEIKILNTQQDADTTRLGNMETVFTTKERDFAEKIAENEARLAIEIAKNEQQEIDHQNEVEKLVAEIGTNSESLSSKEVEFSRLVEELNSARLQLNNLQENLTNSMTQNRKLEDNHKDKINVLEIQIESMQADREKLKKTCDVLQIKLDESLQARKDELARANVKFRNLTRENSTLKSTQQRVKVSSLSQTDSARERALEDQLEEMKKERAAILRRLKNLGVHPDGIDTTSEKDASGPSRLERVIEHDRWTIYHQGHEIGRLRHDLQRLEWLHRQDRSILSRLSQENAAYRKYLHGNRRQSTSSGSQPREHGDHLNAIPEERTVEELRRQSTPIKNSPQNGSDSQEQNHDEHPGEQKSSKIETTPGADVNLQPSSSGTVESNLEKKIINKSSDRNETGKTSHFKRKKRTSKKERGTSLEEEIKNSLRKLPIWRQENPDNDNFDQTILDRLVAEKQSQLDAENSEILENQMSTSNVQHHNCLRHKSLNSSKDDGYASSNNSELNRSFRRRHISSATNDSVFLPDTEHYVINGNDITHPEVLLVDCNDTTSITEVDNSDNNDDQHYYVTFNSVTFDIATFDLHRMRQVTSTFTSEEMPQFCEFMAEVAKDLDANPMWRGRHKLGLPCDWMELKRSF